MRGIYALAILSLLLIACTNQASYTDFGTMFEEPVKEGCSLSEGTCGEEVQIEERGSTDELEKILEELNTPKEETTIEKNTTVKEEVDKKETTQSEKVTETKDEKPKEFNQNPTSIPTIRVKEGELVKLKLSAKDADGDELTYKYGSPLSSDGTWQTDYDDDGRHVVNIEVSDGKAITTQEVAIIVENKNRPPKIEAIKDIYIDEGETLNIKPKVEDPDSDGFKIEYSGFTNEIPHFIDYDEEGKNILVITAIDDKGNNESISINVIVNDINRKPEIISITNG